MDGPTMLLTSMLKMFVTKEQSEAIANDLQRMATDGTFGRIAALPAKLEAIEQALARIEQRLELHAASRHLGERPEDEANQRSHGIEPGELAPPANGADLRP